MRIFYKKKYKLVNEIKKNKYFCFDIVLFIKNYKIKK